MDFSPAYSLVWLEKRENEVNSFDPRVRTFFFGIKIYYKAAFEVVLSFFRWYKVCS